MAKQRVPQQYYDPSAGGEATRVLELQLDDLQPSEPARTNYFSLYWIESGAGEFWADTAEHSFAAGSLLCFTPYQFIRLAPSSPARGAIIQFHANFLCVETFHAESGCAGALFNDPYQSPAITFKKPLQREVAQVVKRMLREHGERPLAFEEMLLAQLKTLLILATRSKAERCNPSATGGLAPRHPVLGRMRELIEQHYARLHAPSDYAKLLHMTPKTLGRVVREQLGKSLTDLIRERVLTHAKWQLLHTLKPIKEVAREVGYGDELYFSRMFKKGTGCSPSFFRDFETEIRGGSNLSMLSLPAPILTRQGSADNSAI